MAIETTAGRKTIYTQSVANEICERIWCGESLKAILRTKGMPAETTFFRWVAENPEFRQHYARAREAQGDADADFVVDIADQVLKGKVSPQAGNVAIQARKWSAGVRKPKIYGNRLDLNHGVQPENPLGRLLKEISNRGCALPVVHDDPDLMKREPTKSATHGCQADADDSRPLKPGPMLRNA